MKFYEMKFNMNGEVVQADGWLAIQVEISLFSICL